MVGVGAILIKGFLIIIRARGTTDVLVRHIEGDVRRARESPLNIFGDEVIWCDDGKMWKFSDRKGNQRRCMLARFYRPLTFRTNTTSVHHSECRFGLNKWKDDLRWYRPFSVSHDQTLLYDWDGESRSRITCRSCRQVHARERGHCQNVIPERLSSITLIFFPSSL